MKKHLLAAAATGATALLAAGSATATDLTVYGLLDTGLNFRSVDADNSAAWSALDGERLTMDSGMTLGSRFGFKAVESITPGVNVGFVLEDGFDSDTGSMMTGRVFGRESQMYLEGTYGKLSFGRVAVLMSDLGSFGLMGELSALSTGYGDAGNHAMVFASFDTRRDNVVTYVSPTYAGLTLHAQYAMGNSNENKSSAEGGRYGALALTYSNDALHVILHVDRLNKNHEERNGNDMVTVTGGVSYKFEPLTLYVGGQYFNNANEVGSSSYGYKLGGFGDIDGWGATIGARAPVMGGTLRVSAGYMDAESDASNEDVTRFIFGVGYEYWVTKRTSWYVAAGYTRDDDVSGNNPTMYQAVAGLRHKF